MDERDAETLIRCLLFLDLDKKQGAMNNGKQTLCPLVKNYWIF